MESKYREADMVTLHDEGMVLACDGYPDAIVGWNEWQSSGKEVKIPGSTIAAILHTMDLPVHPYHTEWWNPRLKKTTTIRNHMEDVDLPLCFFSTSEPDQFKIHKIFARIESGVLVLKLFVSSAYEGEDKKQVHSFFFHRITTSGKFTIWWKCDYKEVIGASQSKESADLAYPELIKLLENEED